MFEFPQEYMRLGSGNPSASYLSLVMATEFYASSVKYPKHRSFGIDLPGATSDGLAKKRKNSGHALILGKGFQRLFAELDLLLLCCIVLSASFVLLEFIDSRSVGNE
ncbi:hypothetical protein BKM31_45445 [[Actinomadura] parvosata subsp. kistnae]|uniref:Uncharacterized protein n=1 Tax=[Actinomadura] parvosata subsp. kistnae TaxID=1909395 RepID=A0A1V0AC44_9ACTN|nr:hypothetical protein BKM31_45445 [Nonomuraea sp. ATCC 55076]